MYNLLCKKYELTKSNKLIFKKHIYDKKEYITNLLRKNKIFILRNNETYKDIVEYILKQDVNCYTKYINQFCIDRVLEKQPISKICYHPPCLKEHQIKIIIVIFIKIKSEFLKIHIKIKIYIYKYIYINIYI